MIEPWTWKQAMAFLIIWTIVCGPWIYMIWLLHNK